MIILTVVVVLFIFALFGIRVVRPTERGLVEFLGKYQKFARPGFNWIFPGLSKMYKINVTEVMSNIQPQEIITEDNLNAVVDLVVYFKIKEDEESVKNAVYGANDVISQITTLARTTARNVIGTMKFGEVNSKRSILNTTLQETLGADTGKWGVEITKVELKEIVPPKNVQDAMNQVIMAENAKRSAIDFATATETQADGQRRAAIKQAEGTKQAAILEAEGQATAFELINKSFTGASVELRKLEVTESALKNNAKIVITREGINPQIILGEIPTSHPTQNVKTN